MLKRLLSANQRAAFLTSAKCRKARWLTNSIYPSFRGGVSSDRFSGHMEQTATLGRGSAIAKCVQGAARQLLGDHFFGSYLSPCKLIYNCIWFRTPRYRAQEQLLEPSLIQRRIDYLSASLNAPKEEVVSKLLHIHRLVMSKTYSTLVYSNIENHELSNWTTRV